MEVQITDPHSDPMPRDIAEKALRECTPSELKVLYAIARQTLGYRKPCDRISLSQFQDKTGMSRHTVIKAIKGLIQDNWILCQQRGQYKVYALVLNECVVQYFHHVFGASVNFALAYGNFCTSYQKTLVHNLHTQETNREKENKKQREAHGIRHTELDKLIDKYGYKPVMQRLELLAGENGKIRNKLAYLIDSLKKGYMPTPAQSPNGHEDLSEMPLETFPDENSGEIQEKEEEAVKTQITDEDFATLPFDELWGRMKEEGKGDG